MDGKTLRADMYLDLESIGWDVTSPPSFKSCLAPTLISNIAKRPDYPITISALPILPDPQFPHICTADVSILLTAALNTEEPYTLIIDLTSTASADSNKTLRIANDFFSTYPNAEGIAFTSSVQTYPQWSKLTTLPENSFSISSLSSGPAPPGTKNIPMISPLPSFSTKTSIRSSNSGSSNA